MPTPRTVPVLPAWQSGLGVVAWCPSDRFWHYFEGPNDELGDGFMAKPKCKATAVGIVRVELQPGLQPHKGQRGRWWRRDERGDLVKGGTEPALLGEMSLPERLAGDVVTREPVACRTCGGPTLECGYCDRPGCESCDEGLCVPCGVVLPTAEVLADRAVYAWEDQSLDPEDDLSVLAGYPGARAEVAAEQARIRTEIGYRVARKAGPTWRKAYLDAREAGEAEEFVAERLCECEPLDSTFADGRPVYSWHRDAVMCRWCRLAEALRAERWEQLLAEMGVRR